MVVDETGVDELGINHTHKVEWPNPQTLTAKPQHSTTTFTAKPTPHTFDGTALQQQLPTFTQPMHTLTSN